MGDARKLMLTVPDWDVHTADSVQDGNGQRQIRTFKLGGPVYIDLRDASFLVAYAEQRDAFEKFWAQVAIAALLGIVVAAFRDAAQQPRHVRPEVRLAIDQLFPPPSQMQEVQP